MGRSEAKRLVALGYDQIAGEYLASKEALEPQIEALLRGLMADLGPESRVLDLGCGAGVPVTRWLAERFRVTGVDMSAAQLALARAYLPGASLIRADMGTIAFAPGSFDAVVSCYAIIHLPREEHPALLASIARWIRPGGRFLATWATGEWEGREEDWLGWGAPMWWSHHDEATNLRLLREAGFTIEHAERREVPERWLWALCRVTSSE
ncbi:MAG: class I SAM-dependent methyltransferase [Chloroflexia bacterium]